METVRGRWFLLEFARRQRAAETERLVHAVDRLERYVANRVETLAAPGEPEPTSGWRLPDRLAERAREFARTVRASGLSEELCARADSLADEFSAFATAAAADARREPAEAAPLVAREPEVAAEPAAAADASDEPIVEACAEEIVAIETGGGGEIEDAEFIEMEAPAPEPLAAEPEAEEEPLAPVDPRLAALSRFQHLSMREKLRLFG